MVQVSVIIPAYNAERTLIETLESVRKQSFTHFEIIVINDGSTDQTQTLAQGISDHHIKIFNYDNAGLATARNRGMSQAQGEFLTFLDADDLWTPDKLEKQYQALKNQSEASIAYSWTSVMDDETGRLNPGVTASFEGDVYLDLFKGNFIASGSNAMIRRSVFEKVGGFCPELKAAEDWEYWLRAARHFQFVVVPEFQILYRQASQTMSSDVGKMRSHLLRVHQQEFQVSPERLQPVQHQSLAYIHRYVAKLLLTRGQGQQGGLQAGQELAQAIGCYPSILWERQTQKLIVQYGLTGLLPIAWTQALLGWVRQANSMTTKFSMD